MITQPALGREPAIDALAGVGVEVYVGAWMLKNVEPLCDCVGVKRPASEKYDPLENLARIDAGYPDFGIYLAQLGFKRDWKGVLTRSLVPASDAIPRELPGAAS